VGGEENAPGLSNRILVRKVDFIRPERGSSWTADEVWRWTATGRSFSRFDVFVNSDDTIKKSSNLFSEGREWNRLGSDKREKLMMPTKPRLKASP
jgi:hypothetical protein